MNTSCGDTVKCRLDGGKSPIFRSQSPCTYIYVQESQRFWDFVRIRPRNSFFLVVAKVQDQVAKLILW